MVHASKLKHVCFFFQERVKNAFCLLTFTDIAMIQIIKRRKNSD